MGGNGSSNVDQSLLEAKSRAKKIEKYAKRFVTVYQNIYRKENVEPHLLLESMKAGLIVEALSIIIQDIVEREGTPQDIEDTIKHWIHNFNMEMMKQGEIAVNQLLALQRQKMQEEKDGKSLDS